jgi:hypothetical protein
MDGRCNMAEGVLLKLRGVEMQRSAPTGHMQIYYTFGHINGERRETPFDLSIGSLFGIYPHGRGPNEAPEAPMAQDWTRWENEGTRRGYDKIMKEGLKSFPLSQLIGELERRVREGEIAGLNIERR